MHQFYYGDVRLMSILTFVSCHCLNIWPNKESGCTSFSLIKDIKFGDEDVWRIVKTWISVRFAIRILELC